MTTIKLGTRGSDLALYQAYHTKTQLESQLPGINVEIIIIHTTGDKRTDVSLNQVAKETGVFDKGVFIKELETALINQDIDIAVHSLKDLPSELDSQFHLASVLERANIADILITKQPLEKWSDLANGSSIATSSVRRSQQWLWQATQIDRKYQTIDIRGNVPTRIAKLANTPEMNGLILAQAGLERLEYPTAKNESFEVDGATLYTHVLPPEQFLPAAGQGAIGIEILSDRTDLQPILDTITHQPTLQTVETERHILKLLQAGCHTPIGIYSNYTDKELTITAELFADAPEGSSNTQASSIPITTQATKPISERFELAQIIVDQLAQLK